MSPELQAAEKLLRWLHQCKNPRISLPDIYQRGPKNLRTQGEVLAAVEILELHGWLHRVEGGAAVDGSFRRDVWRVVGGTSDEVS
jgi:hypothetical protein